MLLYNEPATPIVRENLEVVVVPAVSGSTAALALATRRLHTALAIIRFELWLLRGAPIVTGTRAGSTATTTESIFGTTVTRGSTTLATTFTTTTVIPTILRLVHSDLTAPEVLLIHAPYSSLCLSIRAELHKAEATGPPSLPVRNHLGVGDCSKLFERVFQSVLVGCPW